MATSRAENFQTLLQSFADRSDGDTISVRDLLTIVGRRAHGPVILLLGFIAVSPLTIVPGASWLVAMLTLIFAVQIVLGRRYPWVPKKILDAEFPRKYLLQAVNGGMRWASAADRLTAPRLTFLTDTPFVQLTALACVAAALITFPLGLVPFGPLLPALAILLIGVGLSARDGAFLLLAFAALGAGGLVMMRVADKVAAMLGLT